MTATPESRNGGRDVQIAYLVHDVNDAAVARRVSLFRAGDIAVRLGGFHRDTAPSQVRGVPVTSLGQTSDGALVRRALSVLCHILWPFKLRRLVSDGDVIVARNLETLIIARWVARCDQRLVYECLDIHRLLLGDGAASRLLHRLEDWALRGVDLVFVSAPAFRDEYFRRHIRFGGDILLVENLVPRGAGELPAVIAPPAAKPWVVGWFGMLRCRKTFDMLKALAADGNGTTEVLIAGRPSTDVFQDFEAEAAAAPYVRFVGGYSAGDLPELFGRVHFVWAIDYFEEGLNSTWLLPNRLYESIAHGAVPLALASVATGAWLRGHGIGILLDDPMVELPALFERTSPEAYASLRDAVARIPISAVTMDEAHARKIALTIAGIG